MAGFIQQNRLIVRGSVAALLAIACLSTFLSPSTGASVHDNGWQADFTAGIVGKTVTTVCDKGCIAGPRLSESTAVCPPHSSIVYLVHNGKKLYFKYKGPESVNASLRAAARVVAFLGKPPVTPWTLYKTTTYFNHKTEIWRAANRKLPPNAPDSKFSGFEYWIDKEIPVEPAIVKYNSDTYGWPMLNYLCTRAVCITPGEPPKDMIKTDSLQRITVAKNAFDIPKNYKETSNPKEIGMGMSTGDAQSVIEGILGDEK